MHVGMHQVNIPQAHPAGWTGRAERVYSRGTGGTPDPNPKGSGVHWPETTANHIGNHINMARVPKSANDLVRTSYNAARSFVKRDERRELTQREYLDTTFGLNPRTGKPYNDRKHQTLERRDRRRSG